MTNDFNKLMKSSAPGIPDPGDVRRLNRRFLKKSLVVRERCRRFGSFVVTGCLALTFLAVGGVNDIGSDNFDVTSSRDVGEFLEQKGISKILRLGERGQPIAVLDGWTEDQARELAIQDYNDEGELVEITGWRTATVETWTMGFASEVGGDSIIRGRDPQGVPKKLTREFLDFLIQNASQIMEKPEEMDGAVTRLEDIEIEGVTHTFSVWTFEFPGLGQVNYYRWESDR